MDYSGHCNYSGPLLLLCDDQWIGNRRKQNYVGQIIHNHPFLHPSIDGFDHDAFAAMVGVHLQEDYQPDPQRAKYEKDAFAALYFHDCVFVSAWLEFCCAHNIYVSMALL